MSITWPLGKNTTGAYVHIQDALTGEKYYCPECSGRFVARMGTKVTHHFAHYPGVVCSGEGSRHAIAKHYIASLLENPITLPLICQCKLPTKVYRLEVSNVEVEATVGEYIVDVACKRNGKPIYVEVVDTHPTDLQKGQALRGALVEVIIKDLSDQEVFSGDKVRERLFSGLGSFLPTLSHAPYYFFHTWTTECWKCKRRISVAGRCWQTGRRIWSHSFPDGLLTEMRKYAKLEFFTTSTSLMKNGYRADVCHVCNAVHAHSANVCPSCNAVQGESYLFNAFLDVIYTPEKVVTVLWTKM